MPSLMKSAGYWLSNSSWFSKGQWYWAKGMLPESNQQSMTSGVRRMVPSQPAAGAAEDDLVDVGPVQVQTTGRDRSARSARRGRWAGAAAPQASQIHTFSGVPQNRLRLSDQSMLPASQLPKRPDPTSGGAQAMSALACTSWSRMRLVAMNQLGVAK